LGDAKRCGRNRKLRRQSGAQSQNRHTRDGRRSESGVGGNANGISGWMDCQRWPAGRGQEQYPWEPPRVVPKGSAAGRSARLKMLGNAVVPAQAVVLFEAIMDLQRANPY
jgi:DNA (cytosine-5)-methyltransferase 1